MKEQLGRIKHHVKRHGKVIGKQVIRHSRIAGRHIKKHSILFTRNTKVQAFFMISFGIIILDQMSKWIVESSYKYRPVDVIDGILSVNLVKNGGGSFGILKDQISFIMIFSLFTVIFILFYRERIGSKFQIPLAFITGGILGNLVDRFAFGYVRDFIDIHIWPVFNIADMFIVGGVFLIITEVWRFSDDK